jgi:hypothetical protein
MTTLAEQNAKYKATIEKEAKRDSTNTIKTPNK